MFCYYFRNYGRNFTDFRRCMVWIIRSHFGAFKRFVPFRLQLCGDRVTETSYVGVSKRRVEFRTFDETDLEDAWKTKCPWPAALCCARGFFGTNGSTLRTRATRNERRSLNFRVVGNRERITNSAERTPSEPVARNINASPSSYSLLRRKHFVVFLTKRRLKSF